MTRGTGSEFERHVAYSVPGPTLLSETVPRYAPDVDPGATVRISAHAVLDEPHRVALELVLVAHGNEPHHRETVGDRLIDSGDPDIWIVLTRAGDEPPERLVAAQRVLRWPPPVQALPREV
jgi:hypothetical protein